VPIFKNMVWTRIAAAASSPAAMLDTLSHDSTLRLDLRQSVAFRVAAHVRLLLLPRIYGRSAVAGVQ